jgi:CRISPR/Cas system Type II protein with McrA/HNH and RuvC-like nuclease domain
MRKRLNKKQRRRVYDKTSGHCAYCGCELRIEDMQIDHVVPLHNGGRDAPDNMLPACRSCNHYKGGNYLETFRRYVEKMPQTLQRDSVTYRNAVRFGLVEPKPRKIKFYFEQTEGARK